METKRVVVTLSAVLVAGVASMSWAGDTVETAKAAWERRDTATQTVRVKWEEHRIVHRNLFALLAADGKGKEQTGMPDKDVIATYTHTLLLRGDDCRYECDGKRWSAATRQMKPERYIGSLVRGRETSLNDPIFDEGYPQAHLIKRSELLQVMSLTVQPILMTFRVVALCAA